MGSNVSLVGAGPTDAANCTRYSANPNEWMLGAFDLNASGEKAPVTKLPPGEMHSVEETKLHAKSWWVIGPQACEDARKDVIMMRIVIGIIETRTKWPEKCEDM